MANNREDTLFQKQQQTDITCVKKRASDPERAENQVSGKSDVTFWESDQFFEYNFNGFVDDWGLREDNKTFNQSDSKEKSGLKWGHLSSIICLVLSLYKNL